MGSDVISQILAEAPTVAIVVAVVLSFLRFGTKLADKTESAGQLVCEGLREQASALRDLTGAIHRELEASRQERTHRLTGTDG